jgi:phosphoribosylglycinamide formyltransferase-1
VNGGELIAEVVLLVQINLIVCVERARNHQIETFTFNPKEYSSRDDYEVEIVALLADKKVDLIVLAGYMRLIGNVLLNKFAGKIINIHPALLPAFPGTHAIDDAYRYGVKVFGVTIHYVDEGVDTGKIIVRIVSKLKDTKNRRSGKQNTSY